MKRILAALVIFFSSFAPAVANPYGANAVYFNAAATATLVVVQATPGNLNYWNIANPNSSLVYVQFFDAASTGGITLGVTTPKFAIAVPAGNGVTDGVSFQGITFQNGIVIAVTTTPTGSTAPSSSVMITLSSN